VQLGLQPSSSIELEDLSAGKAKIISGRKTLAHRRLDEGLLAIEVESNLLPEDMCPGVGTYSSHIF